MPPETVAKGAENMDVEKLGKKKRCGFWFYTPNPFAVMSDPSNKGNKFCLFEWLCIAYLKTLFTWKIILCPFCHLNYARQRRDVIAQISLAQRLAKKLYPLARMIELPGGHLLTLSFPIHSNVKYRIKTSTAATARKLSAISGLPLTTGVIVPDGMVQSANVPD
ncbi:hypothetical protein L1987_30642 [Smallanthus sonchifolius]|uniref:Uncharacterized protein n=1 Tax=Smallanthus sonchifolius TaxID=185202 RepID=A0ACB9I2R8_9ASTR|nr:hypothetical protein L1987_30642 [Smallanthus sonchifolius]